jgi:hypothetical protein
VRGNTPEVYTLSPLKILWDFSVVCLNLPIVIACGLDFSEKNPLLKENNNKAFFLLLFI